VLCRRSSGSSSKIVETIETTTEEEAVDGSNTRGFLEMEGGGEGNL
jgi:hypothetical protein